MVASYAVPEPQARDNLLNFLQLSQDIVRNDSDSQFRDTGGQILYCFDGSVFRLFCDTIDWRWAIQSFHGSARRDFKTSLGQVEAQTAMVAAEYLLSTDLPAAKNNKIFVTPWHEIELASFLKKNARLLDDAMVPKELIKAEIEAKLDFLSEYDLLTRNKQGIDNRYISEIEKDTSQLQPFLSQGSLIRYKYARSAALLVSSCEHSEKLDQTHRILSPPLLGRLSPILEIFEPNEKGKRDIYEDANRWYFRIKAEDARNRKAVKQSRPDERKPGAIWADAQSIALLRWISNEKLRGDQRLAFVTSDDVLFDAYRRWWIEQDVPEEFFLRRSFQYSPMLNFSDASNDLRSRRGEQMSVQKLFYRIQEAVEIALLPFNLSTVRLGTDYARTRKFAQHREHLALTAKSAMRGSKETAIEHFFSNVSEGWWNEIQKEFGDLTVLWSNLERICIGFFFDLITRRLEDDNLLFGMPKEYVDIPENREKIINFFEQTIDAVAEKSKHIWLPAIESFVRSTNHSSELFGNRISRTIWYEVPEVTSDPNLRLPSRRLVDALLEKAGSDKLFASLLSDSAAPEAPYMFAAIYAMGMENYWRADEFIDYALSIAKKREVPPRVHIEICFCAGQIKRFLLGDLHNSGITDFWQSSQDKMHFELYLDAKRNLLECVRLEEANLAGEERYVHVARVYAELAAVELFYSYQLLFSSRAEKISSQSASKNKARAEECSVSAKDLCWKGLVLLNLSSDGIEVGIDEVKEQCLHNIGASEVIRYLLVGSESFQFDDKINDLIGDGVFDDYEKRRLQEPALRAEFSTFQMLYKFAEADDFAEWETLLSQGKEAALFVDRMLASEISNVKNEIFSHLV